MQLSVLLSIASTLFVAVTSASLPGGTAPAPAARSNIVSQATRQQVVARSRARPAKRQTSAAPYPTCPNSPLPAGQGTSYATFFDTRILNADTGSNIDSTSQSSYTVCIQRCEDNGAALYCRSHTGRDNPLVANFADSVACGTALYANGICDLFKQTSGLGSENGYTTAFKGTTCAGLAATDEGAPGRQCCNTYIN